MERCLFGLVSGVEVLSGGILRLQVSEAEANNISVRFLRKTGEPATGKTRPETSLRQLNTKKGQVYSLLQAKRDVDTLLAMGIMEDVSIVPQPAGDSGKVDLTINAVEWVSGGISTGGRLSTFKWDHKWPSSRTYRELCTFPSESFWEEPKGKFFT